MNKRIRTGSFLYLVLALLLTAALPFYVSAGEGAKADAHYLEKSVVYRLNADGGWELEYRHAVKLNTYFASERALGRTEVKYDPKFQELKFLGSETEMVDGKKVASPANAYTEVLPREAKNFSGYAHLRRMVVAHTALERGAVVRVHYRLTTKPGLMPYLSDRQFLAEPFPADKLSVTVSVPKGTPFHWAVFNLKEVKPLKKEEAGHVSYTFAVENAAAYTAERYNGDVQRPALLFSTAADWKKALPPVLMDEKVKLPEALVKGAKGIKHTNRGDAFLFKLSQLVIDEMSNCHVGMDLNGFTLRTPEEIYQSGYATSLEKAYLLWRLARHLGLKAEITAYPSLRMAAPKVPSLLHLGYYMVKILPKGGEKLPVYLDPVHRSERLYPYGTVGVQLFNLHRGAFEVVEPAGQTENRLEIIGRLNPTKEKTSGELDITLSGAFYPYNSVLDDCGRGVMSAVRGVFPISKLDIKRVRLLSRDAVSVTATVEGKVLKELYSGRYRIDAFRFPYLRDEMTALDSRVTPLSLRGKVNFRTVLHVKVPEGMKVSYAAPAKEVTNDAGYFRSKVGVPGTGNIMIDVSLGLPAKKIKPADYAAFKEVVNASLGVPPLVMLKEKS